MLAAEAFPRAFDDDRDKSISAAVAQDSAIEKTKAVLKALDALWYTIKEPNK